jgi:hypothetical protein
MKRMKLSANYGLNLNMWRLNRYNTGLNVNMA